MATPYRSRHSSSPFDNLRFKALEALPKLTSDAANA